MNRTLLFAAGLIAASSAFANDVDMLPNGYVSAVIRDAQSESTRRAANASAVKTRSQATAEIREAARLGLLNAGGTGAVDVTPEQLRQIEQAGLRALAGDSAAK